MATNGGSGAATSNRPPPGEWRYWLILAGRGFGKTRAGAEWVRAQVAAGRRRIALIGPTAADVRDVMIEGESGLLNVSLPHERPSFQPSRRRVVWPDGAMAFLYSAQEPERLRGPQHDAAWADELAAWTDGQEVWDQLQFGLRLGDDPRVVITTTPKPLPLVRQLIADPHCVVTRGSTFDNRINVPAAFIERIIRRYEGTRLGRQELHAELLGDVPGALWPFETLLAARIAAHPDLRRVVVAVDPSGSNGADNGDQQGIVVAGIGVDGQGYVLADRTCRLSPEGWGRRAVEAFDHFGADRIVAEKNYGGDMVRFTIQTVRPTVPVTLVTASRGKIVRAEPVSALYEQGRVRHLILDLADNPLAELERGAAPRHLQRLAGRRLAQPHGRPGLGADGAVPDRASAGRGVPGTGAKGYGGAGKVRRWPAARTFRQPRPVNLWLTVGTNANTLG